MKKILLVLVLIAAFIITYRWFKSYPKTILLFVQPKPTSYPQHPYAIDSLMSHVVQDGKITVVREVTGQKGFRSYIISYLSENLKLYALMNIPVGKIPPGGWPVVIVNHGHITPRLYSTTASYRNTSAFYANQGFLVLKPDYRGHDQSEGIGEQFISRSQYTVDALNLIYSVNSITEANPSKIFLYGHSMGGDISLQIAEVTDRIKGVSLWAPAVSTFPESITYFTRRYNLQKPEISQLQEQSQQIISQYGINQFSSLSHIGSIKAPFIVQQSTADESVPFSWGEDLVKALQSAGKTVTFYSYPGDNHDIAGHFTQALTRDVDFFRSLSQ